MAIRTNYSFTDFYNTIKNKINEFSEDKPTYWGNGSIAKAIVQSVAYFNEFLQLQLNIAFSSFRIKTAKGIHLDNRVADFGLTRLAATNAVTIQNFVGTTGRVFDIIIPAGTIVTTTADIFGNSISYSLNTNINLSSGAVEVTGLVTCSQIGAIGNVASGAINVLPTTIVGVDSTYNIEDVSNGVEDETDNQFRARVANFIKGLPRGNKFAIESEVYKVEGVSFVKVTENHPTAGNFSIYVTTESGVVDSLLRSRVAQAVERVKAFCITYSIITSLIYNTTIEMDVEIDGESYEQAPLQELIQLVIQDYVNKKKISILNMSDVIYETRKLSGVRNVKNVIIDGVAADLVKDNSYAIKISDEADITINFI